jgi:hypothetical protein
VVLVGSEDGIRDTVLPRLRAAGADLRRVHVFAGRARAGVWTGLPCFPEDCALLAETLEETGARLVIVDPLLAFLSYRVSSLSGSMVRLALGPLAQVAANQGAAIVLVRHLTKGGRGDRACYRGIGSIALIGIARMAFLVATSPADEELHVLACTKSNLALPPPSLGFRIAASDLGPPVIHWAGPVDISADELVLNPRFACGQALDRAKEFLQEQLRPGPCAFEELRRKAQELGFSERTLRRAKDHLQVVTEQKRTDGRTSWYWRLRDSEDVDDSLSWPEKHAQALAQAQKESDALMARIRAKYADKPVTTNIATRRQ